MPYPDLVYHYNDKDEHRCHGDLKCQTPGEAATEGTSNHGHLLKGSVDHIGDCLADEREWFWKIKSDKIISRESYVGSIFDTKNQFTPLML